MKGWCNRYNKMQNNKKIETKQLRNTSKGFSNLVFNEQKRGISALSIVNSPHKVKSSVRQHNIMLLKRNKKQNYVKEQAYERQQQSDEMKPNFLENNRVNVINLMNCSMSTTPKVKSHYCKKITLTNVDKYYEFCLKKMKSMCTAGQKEPEKMMQRPLSTRRYRAESPRRILSNQLQAQSVQLKKANSCSYTPTSSYLLDRKPSQITHEKYHDLTPQKPKIPGQDLVYLQNSYSYMCPKHHHHQSAQDPRKIQTSLACRQKNLMTRRYVNTSQHNRSSSLGTRTRKNEFVIDAWEASQNIIDDAF